MDWTGRVELAQRLLRAERALQLAVRMMDGSLAARTRLAAARAEARAADAAAVVVLQQLQLLDVR